MIGFIIGTACLLGFVRMAFGRARFGRCGGYGGYGYGFDGGEGCGPRDRFGRGGWDDEGEGGEGRLGRGARRIWLRGLFEWLDTTPGQEKVIVAAIDEAKKAAGDARGELDKSRAEAADVLRSPTFDAEALGAIFARQNAALESLQKAAGGALGKVHEALDERQRKALAELLERGPRRWGRGRGRGHGGPYRGH